MQESLVDTRMARARSFAQGTFIGRQDGAEEPSFWVWRPRGRAVEHWVLHEPADGSGYRWPGPSHADTTLRLTLVSPAPHLEDLAEFLSWVESSSGLPSADLRYYTHDLTPS